MREPAPSPAFDGSTLALFGEALGGEFDRGVGQYPTVGDEVHLVTPRDLRLIYGGAAGQDSITIGRVAASGGIPARLRVSSLVAVTHVSSDRREREVEPRGCHSSSR